MPKNKMTSSRKAALSAKNEVEDADGAERDGSSGRPSITVAATHSAPLLRSYAGAFSCCKQEDTNLLVVAATNSRS